MTQRVTAERRAEMIANAEIVLGKKPPNIILSAAEFLNLVADLDDAQKSRHELTAMTALCEGDEMSTIDPHSGTPNNEDWESRERAFSARG